MTPNLIKDAFREAFYNKKRFLLTTLVVFLLSIFFVGFNNSLLDAKITEDTHKNQNNYMDILLSSKYGFDTNDYDEFKDTEHVTGVMMVNSNIMKAKINGKKATVKTNSIPTDMSLDNKDYINRFFLSSGRFPSTINEGIVEEKLLKQNHLSLGSLITLVPEDKFTLRAKKIKIVGTFKEDVYNLDSDVKYTIYLPANNFAAYTYQNVYVTVDDVKNINDVYKKLVKNMEDIQSDKYKTEIEISKSEIASLKESIEDLKNDEDSKEELNDLEESLKSEEIKLHNLENPENKIVVTKGLGNSVSYEDKINTMTTQSIIISILFSLITPVILSILVIKLFKSKKREVRTLLLINCNQFDVWFKYVFYTLLVSFVGILFGGIVSNTLIPMIILRHYDSTNIVVSFQVKYMLYSFLITFIISSLITCLFMYKIMNNKEFKLAKILKRIKKCK